MIVDTSAFVAILYREPEAQAFVAHEADVCHQRRELCRTVDGDREPASQLGPDVMRRTEALFRRAGVVVEPVTLDHGELAQPAFLDFGKGRHEAGLKFGVFFLCARQGDRRSPPVQGRLLRPDRHQARMSRPPALPEAETMGRSRPQNSSRSSRPPGPTHARRRPETPTAPTPPTGATICAGAPARASTSGRWPTPSASVSISPRCFPRRGRRRRAADRRHD